ncbi:hypothetical protein PI86_05740 [Burkholderia sp. A9]|uniref:hypothetical protein n=1 Tax=Burkholderia sp. A9 TaxID=1365108 RepID=UPI00057462FE|nr:hypothetical protein [Burkholderia sp. A9]KHK60091.1 hypothetical protein PI86_05740 [Burkholderia sp. A9]
MKTTNLLCPLVVGLLVSLVAPDVVADDERKGTSDIADHLDVDLPAGMQRYVIPMQGCAIDFIAQKGGDARAYTGSSGPYGYFSHGSYVFRSKTTGSLVVGLSCYRGNAKELCSKLLPSEKVDDRRYYNIRRLNNIHPIYFGAAQISSYAPNSSHPGQVRKISFCLGDDTHALITNRSDIEVGYDTRDVSETPGKKLQTTAELALPEVLKLIRSIRFMLVDDDE